MGALNVIPAREGKNLVVLVVLHPRIDGAVDLAHVLDGLEKARRCPSEEDVPSQTSVNLVALKPLLLQCNLVEWSGNECPGLSTMGRPAVKHLKNATAQESCLRAGIGLELHYFGALVIGVTSMTGF
jgi:hypothetical protein